MSHMMELQVVGCDVPPSRRRARPPAVGDVNDARGQNAGMGSVESGRVFAGRYRLVTRLGRGGFGEVWRAEDTVLGRQVAVKTLIVSAGDDALLRRFEREAHALARLDHPNIVAVYDTGADDGTGFVVMQLLAGPSLAALVAERGPLPLAQALDYASQAAAGLAAAHAAAIVHRDVSPANLLLDGADTLKLVDFGVARLDHVSTALTATGTVFATAGYVSPEQAAGQPADARSDLYSLGCVLYALLAGEPPFTAEHPIGVVQQQLTSPPPLLSTVRAGVPAALDELLTTLLAKNPADRPNSAEEVQRRLYALRAQLDGTATPTTPALPLTSAPTLPLARAGGPLRTRRSRLTAALALALLALAGVLATTLFTGGRTVATTSNAAASTARATTTAPTTATTTPPTTTTAPTIPAALQTPAQAIAAARTTIAAAQTNGQLDPSAATDLNHHLDDIAQALQHPNPNDAAHKVSDLLHHLDDLAHAGQLTNTGLTQISTPLNQLATLLPATPGKGEKGQGNDNGDNGNG
jgi:serine/threonine-protein kinase